MNKEEKKTTTVNFEDNIETENERRHKNAMNENKDFYLDFKTGYQVFTEKFLKERRYCCNSGCRHCSY